MSVDRSHRKSKTLGVPLFFLLGFATVFASCSSRELVEIRGRAMGTTYSVKYVGVPSSRASVSKAVELVLEEIDEIFSTYRDDSVVARLNEWRGSEPFDAGDEFCVVLRRALRIADATDGAFDPTIHALVRVYPFQRRDRSSPPTAGEIESALLDVGYRKVSVEGETAVRKDRPGVGVDTNAFAKGHGVDRVAAELARLGYVDHLVEIGGEVRCRGAKPDGELWRIGVESPTADGRRAVQEAVALRDESLATSGDYRQYFESGGRRIHHILDPRTGVNAVSDVVSVSVRARDCAFADALATALMVTGPDAVPRIREALLPDEFAALFLIRGGDGSVERREFDW